MDIQAYTHVKQAHRRHGGIQGVPKKVSTSRQNPDMSHDLNP